MIYICSKLLKVTKIRRFNIKTRPNGHFKGTPIDLDRKELLLIIKINNLSTDSQVSHYNSNHYKIICLLMYNIIVIIVIVIIQ